jgi:hypothetical protein
MELAQHNFSHLISDIRKNDSDYLNKFRTLNEEIYASISLMEAFELSRFILDKIKLRSEQP